MILKYNISYEVASTIFLIALLFYIKLQYDTHTRLNIEFRKLTWVGLFATVMDVTTAITISYPDVIPIKLNILLNTVYFILVAALGYQLMFYDMYYVYRDGLNRKFIRFQKILIGCYIGLLITNIFAGFLFSFTEDGTYVKGPAHLTVYLAPFYFIFCSAVILICNLRKFRVWQSVSIFLFIFLQIAGMVLQMFFFPDTLLALFMSALGLMMMLFTMETPDYQKLVITIDELSTMKKMAEEAKEEAERAKEAAMKANRAKSDFMANMSHEIRTPINAVLGMDEMILRESTDPQILEYASNIRQAGSMLLSLINDILDFSKIESGKMDIIPVDYDLGILLGDTVDMIRSRAEEKKLQLEMNIDPNTPVHLHGDEVRVRQVLTNMLTNAVKYTTAGKVILTVSPKKLSEDTVELFVSVKDTGIGIKEEDIGRLFDSFQRVDESRNRNIEGTGLGLSISMHLLNLMGSTLQVKSTYGEGSEFYFSLDQRQLDDEVVGEDIRKYCEHEKGKISVAVEQFYAPDARILVVDENEMNLKVFKGLLKNPKSDVSVLLITFFLTVIFDLTVAIEVGLVIACVLFMRRVMETTEISVITDEIDPNKESDLQLHEEHLVVPKGVEVYEINGPYFFGIATKFEDIMSELGDRPKIRIIRMRKVPFIDSTGIHNLTILCEMSKKENIHIILSGVNPKVYAVLEKSGFCSMLGKENICSHINEALEVATKELANL